MGFNYFCQLMNKIILGRGEGDLFGVVFRCYDLDEQQLFNHTRGLIFENEGRFLKKKRLHLQTKA